MNKNKIYKFYIKTIIFIKVVIYAIIIREGPESGINKTLLALSRKCVVILENCKIYVPSVWLQSTLFTLESIFSSTLLLNIFANLLKPQEHYLSYYLVASKNMDSYISYIFYTPMICTENSPHTLQLNKFIDFRWIWNFRNKSNQS